MRGGGWSVGLLVLGVLTVILGIFMLTVQFCTAWIMDPVGGETLCLRWAPAFLFSGSFTIFLGGIMVLSAAISWGEEY